MPHHPGSSNVGRRLRAALAVDNPTRFRLAVKSGDVGAVRKLLENGMSPHHILEGGMSALKLAAHRGQFDVFRALLDADGVDPNPFPENELKYWLTQKRFDVVDVLLGHDKVDPNQRDANGDTLMHLAVRAGKRDWAKALLGKANLALTDKQGMTPVDLAAQSSVRMLKQMLESGVDINGRDDEGRTSLHRAVALCEDENLPALVARYLRYGADPLVKDVANKTPLEAAVEKNRPAAARALLDDARVCNSVSDSTGRRILRSAIVNSPASIPLLVTAGVNPGAPELGQTPLEHAVLQNRSESVAILLSQPGVEEGLGGSTGAALLRLAIMNSPDSIPALIAAGADPGASDETGAMPVQLAIQHDRPEIVAAMLAAGSVREHMRGRTGEALLRNAVFTSPASIAMLIEAGVNPTAFDDSGDTPLDIAVLNNRPESVAALAANPIVADAIRGPTGGRLVRDAVENSPASIAFLVAAGADPNAKAYSGKTPLELAVERGCVDSVRELLRAGADPKAGTARGGSLYDLATARGNNEIRWLLLLGAGASSSFPSIEAVLSSRS
ncbi:ankyrin repeat domain-containing protein [Noviherbaspirillum aridicola]|uniref:Ankyrin repeat protein n=1 Tax=Noviherbaspirillum aridicola TaxID=2849687 RepID=A0ABQ4Q799_9BURK|nr:ankyrin repeat domain-containing protein [Noviherbaspirillum aridicola]GIZ53070.1 hypothetical protein NCCP691_30840 [Noviherbaspirillum aridicola]